MSIWPRGYFVSNASESPLVGPQSAQSSLCVLPVQAQQLGPAVLQCGRLSACGSGPPIVGFLSSSTLFWPPLSPCHESQSTSHHPQTAREERTCVREFASRTPLIWRLGTLKVKLTPYTWTFALNDAPRLCPHPSEQIQRHASTSHTTVRVPGDSDRQKNRNEPRSSPPQPLLKGSS